jgi:hypothetical protein
MTKITFEEVMKKLEKREQKTRVFVDELWNDFNQLKDAENLEEAYRVLTQISQLECFSSKQNQLFAPDFFDQLNNKFKREEIKFNNQDEMFSDFRDNEDEILGVACSKNKNKFLEKRWEDLVNGTAYDIQTFVEVIMDNFFDDSLSSKISAQVSKEEFIKLVKAVVVENRYTSASFAYDYEGYGYSSSSLFC